MAKKKHKSRPKYRNAAPRPPSAPRAPRTPLEEEETPSQRLAYTAAGAAGTALVGGFLAKQDWKPKTIAGVLTAVGTAMAWIGNTPQVKSLGAGAMAAGGGQLALQVLDDRDREQQTKKEPPPARRQANANELSPGALESAFERARMQLGLTSDDYADAA